jgi:hypothetical protein
MTTEGFLNTYHNASSPPAGDVPEELARFMAAADPVLAQAAELSRVLARARGAATTKEAGHAAGSRIARIAGELCGHGGFRAP